MMRDCLMKIGSIALAGAAVALSLTAFGGDGGFRRLDVVSPEMWSAPDKVAISTECGKLKLTVSAVVGDGVQHVRLKSPIAVPTGQILRYDLCTSRIRPTMLNLLVRDAAGREFRLRQEAAGMLNQTGTREKWGSNYVGGIFREGRLDRVGTVRVHVPALANPKRGTHFAEDGKHPEPKPPFEILGFTLHVLTDKPLGRGETFDCHFSEFAMGMADQVTDGFFAVFADQKLYGGLGESPTLIYENVNRMTWRTKERPTLAWEMFDRYDGDPIRRGTLVEGNPVTLPRMPAGTYWVRTHPQYANANAATMELRYDVFRNVALASAAKGEPEPVALPEPSEPFRFPAGVPDWREVRDGKDPLILFAPMVDRPADAEWTRLNVSLYDEMVKSGDTMTAEIQNRWRDCEPMPGRYDFSELLATLDGAAKRGVRCFVTFAPLSPPEWMPSIFTKNKRGESLGHTIYLFHGGRINLFHSPYVRSKALAYLAALVQTTRNHPGCLGYFFITEHEGEAPWAEWYEGFDDWTLGGFRRAMSARYGDIAAANAAWKTSFASFDAAMPPDAKEEASLAFRRDWLTFRRNASHDFILDAFRTIRRFDDRRIIMCYTGGILTARIGELARFGAISANGGCDRGERAFNVATFAEAGMPQRAEEISCSNWRAHGDTQLDASTFAMLGGGGLAANFKMFTPRGVRFDEFRRMPNGFDRFERFIPIWKELRDARPVFGDLRIWSAWEGRIAESRTVSGGFGAIGDGWDGRIALDSQLVAGTRYGAPENWRSAKALWAPPGLSVLASAEADELAEYVNGGGRLVMGADVGRRIVEREDEDWTLLRRFGFAPPAREIANRYVRFRGLDGAEAVGRTEFVAPAEGFGEALMRKEDGTVAVSRKAFGKGAVDVIWCRDIVPYAEAGLPFAKPFLPELFRSAGVEPPVTTECRLDWAYPLRASDDRWYLLTMCAPMSHSRLRPDLVPQRERHFRVRLPKGRWTLKDLISGEEKGTYTAEELADVGFLDAPRCSQVRIWRMTR